MREAVKGNTADKSAEFGSTDLFELSCTYVNHYTDERNLYRHQRIWWFACEWERLSPVQHGQRRQHAVRSGEHGLFPVQHGAVQLLRATIQRIRNYNDGLRGQNHTSGVVLQRGHHHHNQHHQGVELGVLQLPWHHIFVDSHQRSGSG